MGALAENMPGSRCGPMPVGWTSVKYMRHCFHRAATISAPMKVSRLSRFPVSLLQNSTSVWSTPSIGRSLGILLPMRRAKVGKKSIVENIAYEVVSRLDLAGPADEAERPYRALGCFAQLAAKRAGIAH